jgi:uncharacterized protein YbjT (DUF2867 family)
MKALIIGATGLIGNCLLDLIEKDNYFNEVEIWVRRAIETRSTKITVKIIDFDHLPDNIEADAVFCCVGTTIQKAGSKEAFLKVDYEIPVNIAKRCQQSGLEKFFVISSLGANQSSGNFYLNTKGRMELAVSQMNIPTVVILRPSLLFGKRDEFRLGERLAIFFMKGFGVFFFGKLKKYRGIEAYKVAFAMLRIAKDKKTGNRILESDEIENNGK